MANNTTVAQGYLDGASQVKKFMEKAIGSEEAYIKEMTKLKAAFDEFKSEFKNTEEMFDDEFVKNNKKAQKIVNKMKEIKSLHHRAYSHMKNYGKYMEDLSNESTIIDEKTISVLINYADGAGKRNVFDFENGDWTSQPGVKAMKKFTDMLIDNDLKKFQYYNRCLEEKSFKGLSFKEIMDLPVPKTAEPGIRQKENLTDGINELVEKLNKADSILHRNSKEFNEMKSAAIALKEAMANNASEYEIGACLEALQLASMEYAKAKGVGMQSSQMGKDRMDASLDLCALATRYMDFYTSERRMKELAEFEQRTMGKQISNKKGFDYKADMDEVIKAAVNPINANVMDDKETVQTKQNTASAATPAPTNENTGKTHTPETPEEKAVRIKKLRKIQARIEFPKNLELPVRALSDPEKIQEVLDNNPGLEDLEKEHLKKRIALCKKVQKYEKNRNLGQKKRPSCMKNEDGTVILLNKQKDVPKQTTRNGCWSCVLSDMLGHFGVDFTQQDIRLFRPELRDDKGELDKTGEKLVKRLSGDNTNEIYDVADLIHRTVPNVALHHMSISVRGDKTIDFFKDKIKDILVNKNSPVALLAGGHYISVVGMKGNMLVIQDPNSKTDAKFEEISAERIYARCKTGSIGDSVVIDWLEDLEFTKDGKCKNVTEETKAYGFDCNDGEFNQSEGEKYWSHVKGYEYTDYSNLGNGVEEVIYTPKMSFEKEMSLAKAMDNQQKENAAPAVPANENPQAEEEMTVK